MDWISHHHHSWVCWNLAKWPTILPPNSLGALPQRLTYIGALLCGLGRRRKAVFCSPMPRVRGVVNTAIGKLFAPVTRQCHHLIVILGRSCTSSVSREPSRWRFCTKCVIYRSRQCICFKGCSDRLPNNFLIIEPWLFLPIKQVSVNCTWGCGPFCKLFGNIVTRRFVFGTRCPNRVTIWTLTLETLTKGLCCLNGCGPLH